MWYVYSTLTSDNIYRVYNYSNLKNDKNALPIGEKDIFIKGGHKVATKHLITPNGVVTQIEDADYELLQKDVHFQNHVKAGFIKCEKKKVEKETVVKDLKSADESTPLTPKNFDRGNQPKSYKGSKKDDKPVEVHVSAPVVEEPASS